MGSGHGRIDFVFANSLGALALATIFALKLAACTVSIGSGFRGGLFSASLFLGALLGGALGTLVVQQGLMPHSALLGMEVVAMSAFGAAVVGAPLAITILCGAVREMADRGCSSISSDMLMLLHRRQDPSIADRDVEEAERCNCSRDHYHSCQQRHGHRTFLFVAAAGTKSTLARSLQGRRSRCVEEQGEVYLGVNAGPRGRPAAWHRR